MRFLYTAILYLLLPLVMLRLAWRSLWNPEYLARWGERFGRGPALVSGRPVVCIHAVSVGEVMAAQPLVRLLATQFPAWRIVVSTVTPTGAATVRQHLGDAVTHAYFPFDLPWAVESFLRRLRPRLMIIMETELWPNLFHACGQAGVPLVLANARLSSRSLRRYLLVPGLARELLRSASLILAQTRLDSGHFVTMGADPEKVAVCGNIKFDLNLPHSVTEQGQAIRRLFSAERPVWIGASTHQGEERVLLKAFRTILRSHPDCVLILAPRHPERFDSVAQLCGKLEFRYVRRSAGMQSFGRALQVFLLDSIGELPVFYASSDLAFVGGSLVPAGGHNVLEAACLGVPLLTGPHMHNFTEITDLLTCAQALQIVTDTDSLARSAGQLLSDANLRHAMGERARAVFHRNQGAAQSVMNSIAPLLG